ncbi:MAG: helix-turn-helix transcriptional regulator [Lachnospiraceae bacterium]|nr:helix-turn-helix transcriptional regulator [Lachnospiraceae bacterium]
MGKKSIRENKNIYQTSREALEYTREKAGELMEYVSADRIEKIESGKSLPHPDEIIAMADCYKNPLLCNYYCTHECPIGQSHVDRLELKDLSQIVLEILSSLNAFDHEKMNLVDITVDGEITEDEYAHFAKIKNQLDAVAVSVKNLELWLDQTIADGKIDRQAINEVLGKLRN